MGNSGHCGSDLDAPGKRRDPHCLTTADDFLEVYLHRLDLAANEACPLCSHVRMVGDFLIQCSGLDEYPTDDIVSRYWEARRQMVKNPS
ncbi:reverse transcriptase [Trichonephila clavipes]|nr:reverse transcriptase [Trichonephila clavipes]